MQYQSISGKVCNGHGTCQFNATVNSLECNCNNGWRGDQCQCRDVVGIVIFFDPFYSQNAHNSRKQQFLQFDLTRDKLEIPG